MRLTSKAMLDSISTIRILGWILAGLFIIHIDLNLHKVAFSILLWKSTSCFAANFTFSSVGDLLITYVFEPRGNWQIGYDDREKTFKDNLQFPVSSGNRSRCFKWIYSLILFRTKLKRTRLSVIETSSSTLSIGILHFTTKILMSRRIILGNIWNVCKAQTNNPIVQIYNR